MAQKRSQQYDWFKGTAANGGKKDPKKSAKTVWKFTKIFIYLSLFVFSMTGCIQSLIIKTTNYVGTGVEFYSSEKEVAPHVSRLDVRKIDAVPADPANNVVAAPEVYDLSSPSSNIWLSNDLADAAKKAGKASLADVQTAVSTQSSSHEVKDATGNVVGGNLKLQDAFKGSNEALWISQPGESGTFEGVSMADATSGKVPLVLSSLADQSAFDKMTAATDDLKDINFYSIDKDGKYTLNTLGTGSLATFEDAEYIKAKFDAIKSATAADTTITITSGSVESMLAAAEASKVSSVKAMVAQIRAEYNKAVARQAYSLAALKATLTTKIKTWLTDSAAGGKAPSQADLDKINTDLPAQIKTLAAALAAVEADATLTGTAKETAIKAAKAALAVPTDELNLLKEKVSVRQLFVQGDGDSHIGLMGAFNLAVVDAKDLSKGFKFKANSAPFMSNSATTWRPLVTWADAWGEGPFYGLFVYPVAYISANMIASFPGGMAGWETLISIFVIVFSIRILTFLLSFKATMQQTRLQELQAKKAVIDAKYAPYKGNKQMENRQKQEVSEMYKKHGVSPMGSMTSIFITMPFFLAIWRTIGALPHIKSTVWLGINFSATSWRELFAGSFQYLPLMILAAGFAAFQQILPRLLTKRRDRTRINIQQKAAMKKGNKTQNIMMLVFVFMSLIFSAGLQVYWIAGGIWMSIQSTITHFLIIRQSKKRKRDRIKV